MAAQVAGLILAASVGPIAARADRFDGPYFGVVERVIDGDTFEATVEVWPNLSATVSVRISGIDAPELFRPQCPQERLGAQAAKEALQEIAPAGTAIRLEDVELGSFAGRVIAVAYRQGESRGRTLVELLSNRGVVEEWTSGDADVDWCAGMVP